MTHTSSLGMFFRAHRATCMATGTPISDYALLFACSRIEWPCCCFLFWTSGHLSMNTLANSLRHETGSIVLVCAFVLLRQNNQFEVTARLLNWIQLPLMRQVRQWSHILYFPRRQRRRSKHPFRTFRLSVCIALYLSISLFAPPSPPLPLSLAQ